MVWERNYGKGNSDYNKCFHFKSNFSPFLRHKKSLHTHKEKWCISALMWGRIFLDIRCIFQQKSEANQKGPLCCTSLNTIICTPSGGCFFVYIKLSSWTFSPWKNAVQNRMQSSERLEEKEVTFLRRWFMMGFPRFLVKALAQSWSIPL